MPYWEYEYFLKFANEMIEEENKNQEEQSGGYDRDSINRRSESMMKNAQRSVPKMPSMPKMPSFSMPKI